MARLSFWFSQISLALSLCAGLIFRFLHAPCRFSHLFKGVATLGFLYSSSSDPLPRRSSSGMSSAAVLELALMAGLSSSSDPS